MKPRHGLYTDVEDLLLYAIFAVLIVIVIILLAYFGITNAWKNNAMDMVPSQHLEDLWCGTFLHNQQPNHFSNCTGGVSCFVNLCTPAGNWLMFSNISVQYPFIKCSESQCEFNQTLFDRAKCFTKGVTVMGFEGKEAEEMCAERSGYGSS